MLLIGGLVSTIDAIDCGYVEGIAEGITKGISLSQTNGCLTRPGKKRVTLISVLMKRLILHRVF